MKKIAVLVISHVFNDLYKFYIDNHWTKIVNDTKDNQDIDVYFLYSKDHVSENFGSFSDNVIVDLKSQPGYQPGILQKTISAFKILSDKYDVFFRTNLSSVIRPNRLLKHVNERDVIYSGGIVFKDIKDNYKRYIGYGLNKPFKSEKDFDNYPGDSFVSGCGFLMNKQEVRYLISQENKIRYDLPDDFSIGLMMQECQHLSGFTKILTNNQNIEKSVDEFNKEDWIHCRLQHFPIEQAQEFYERAIKGSI